MTELQNEILKLLKETKEQLNEVSFDNVTQELLNLNGEIDKVDAMLKGPAEKMKSDIRGIKGSLQNAMTIYNQIETYYKNRFEGGKAALVPSYKQRNNKDAQNQLSKLNNNLNNSNTDNKDITLDPSYWDKVNNKGKQTNQKSQNNQAETPAQTTVQQNSTNTPPEQTAVQQVAPAQQNSINTSPEQVEQPKQSTSIKKAKTAPKKTSLRKKLESIEESNLEVQKEGMMDKVLDFMGGSHDKEIVASNLNDVSDKLSKAHEKINDCRLTYATIYRQLEQLIKKIETAQKLVDKKRSFFGRTFGFWK